MTDTKKTPRGGYSLFSTYNRCQRQFYFKYIRRWAPLESNQKAAWGRVIHAVSQGMYNVDLPQDSESADYWEARTALYDRVCIEEGLTTVDYINRGWELIQKWLTEIFPGDAHLRPIYMDKMMGVKVNGWEFLFRPDRVLYDSKFNRYILFEVKSTMYSLEIVAATLKKTYQTTGYLWGFNRKFQTKINDVQPEVWYTRGKVQRIQRTAPIYRSDSELIQFGSDLHYWIDEVMRKYENPLEHNFPRCFQCTEGSNFKCDYSEICPQRHEGHAVPIGFMIRKEKIK